MERSVIRDISRTVPDTRIALRFIRATTLATPSDALVIPTGYSFNLDAFSIYLTLAVVFIAQATNTPLSFGDLLLGLGFSLITRTACRTRRSSSAPPR
jgi:Sodium:dicarboxylate symporter family